MCATTYPQLATQAIEAGFDEENLGRLKKTYEIAEALFDGFYRGQGMPFINHLVRTAGIVINERPDPDLVFAALLHAVYSLGQFEDGVQGKATKAHRFLIQDVAGFSAEELVYQYSITAWREAENGILFHSEHFNEYEEPMKLILILRLANELEDYSDLGMIYRGNFKYREYIEKYGKALVDMAQNLGLAGIALQLESAFQAHLEAEVPACVTRRFKNSYEHPERMWMKKSLKEKMQSLIKTKLKRFNASVK